MGEIDGLTGLLVRAEFETAVREVYGAATAALPASLILVDVDHFKAVNDRHGHQAGDAVLRAVADALGETVRGKGLAYRYGGEELILILPNHTTDEALAVSERARMGIEALEGPTPVTCSFGVAVAPLHASDAAGWVKAADDALYDAKHRGRNLVRLFGEPPPKPDESRKPARKEAKHGVLSVEEAEELRLQIARSGVAWCPTGDDIPLEIWDSTALGDVGKSYVVSCPGCGFHAKLDALRRS